MTVRCAGLTPHSSMACMALRDGWLPPGFAPLSVRLVEISVKPGWGVCGDVLRLLPGPTTEFTQKPEPQDVDKLLRGVASPMQQPEVRESQSQPCYTMPP